MGIVEIINSKAVQLQVIENMQILHDVWASAAFTRSICLYQLFNIAVWYFTSGNSTTFSLFYWQYVL